MRKLDKRKDEVVDLLKKGVHKTSIARIVECTPDTLYRWMEDNGLSSYINSREDKPVKPVKSVGKKRDEKGSKKRGVSGGVVVVSIVARRDGKGRGK
ncbi:MAG: helix-turn-helix domain-containing protein [Candidatus Methylumidiphilus sp.]